MLIDNTFYFLKCWLSAIIEMNFIILGCIMLKRKAVTSIKNWINTKNKKCLVVQGARQTGKTYIIEVKGGKCWGVN